MYEQAIEWIKANSSAHGDAAELMRRAKASKPSWYKLLQGKGVRSENLFEWLENLGFRLLPPDQQESRSRDVCFVNAKVVNAEEGAPPVIPEDYLAIPLTNEAGAGPGIIPVADHESWLLVYKREPSIQTRLTNLIAVRIASGSNSMEPTLHPGDIVLVDRNDKNASTPGGIWLVMEPDGSGKIKRVKLDSVPSLRLTRITFYSDNVREHPPEAYTLENDYDGDINRAIVGRVVWGWGDLTRK